MGTIWHQYPNFGPDISNKKAIVHSPENLYSKCSIDRKAGHNKKLNEAE